MIMVAIGTFCIGIIPDYGTIGMAAPILLLLDRLVQGFSTGGEYGGAMTFIAEYAPDRRRGFLGSWLVRRTSDEATCCTRSASSQVRNTIGTGNVVRNRFVPSPGPCEAYCRTQRSTVSSL
jgi:hypothetical protein